MIAVAAAGGGSSTQVVEDALCELLAPFQGRYTTATVRCDHAAIFDDHVRPQDREKLLDGDPVHAFALIVHASFVLGTFSHFAMIDLLPESNCGRLVVKLFQPIFLAV